MCALWAILGGILLLVCIALLVGMQRIIASVSKLRKLPMICWTVVTVALVLINLHFQQPDIAREFLFKAALVPFFAVAGYWLDRELPHVGFVKTYLNNCAAGGDGKPPLEFLGVVIFAIVTLRQAVIVGFCIFAGTMGV